MTSTPPPAHSPAEVIEKSGGTNIEPNALVEPPIVEALEILAPEGVPEKSESPPPTDDKPDEPVPIDDEDEERLFISEELESSPVLLASEEPGNSSEECTLESCESTSEMHPVDDPQSAAEQPLTESHVASPEPPPPEEDLEPLPESSAVETHEMALESQESCAVDAAGETSLEYQDDDALASGNDSQGEISYVCLENLREYSESSDEPQTSSEYVGEESRIEDGVISPEAHPAPHVSEFGLLPAADSGDPVTDKREAILELDHVEPGGCGRSPYSCSPGSLASPPLRSPTPVMYSPSLDQPYSIENAGEDSNHASNVYQDDLGCVDVVEDPAEAAEVPDHESEVVLEGATLPDGEDGPMLRGDPMVSQSEDAFYVESTAGCSLNTNPIDAVEDESVVTGGSLQPESAEARQPVADVPRPSLIPLGVSGMGTKRLKPFRPASEFDDAPRRKAKKSSPPQQQVQQQQQSSSEAEPEKGSWENVVEVLALRSNTCKKTRYRRTASSEKAIWRRHMEECIDLVGSGGGIAYDHLVKQVEENTKMLRMRLKNPGVEFGTAPISPEVVDPEVVNRHMEECIDAVARGHDDFSASFGVSLGDTGDWEASPAPKSQNPAVAPSAPANKQQKRKNGGTPPGTADQAVEPVSKKKKATSKMSKRKKSFDSPLLSGVAHSLLAKRSQKDGNLTREFLQIIYGDGPGQSGVKKKPTSRGNYNTFNAKTSRLFTMNKKTRRSIAEKEREQRRKKLPPFKQALIDRFMTTSKPKNPKDVPLQVGDLFDRKNDSSDDDDEPTQSLFDDTPLRERIAKTPEPSDPSGSSLNASKKTPEAAAASESTTPTTTTPAKKGHGSGMSHAAEATAKAKQAYRASLEASLMLTNLEQSSLAGTHTEANKRREERNAVAERLSDSLKKDGTSASGAKTSKDGKKDDDRLFKKPLPPTPPATTPRLRSILKKPGSTEASPAGPSSKGAAQSVSKSTSTSGGLVAPQRRRPPTPPTSPFSNRRVDEVGRRGRGDEDRESRQVVPSHPDGQGPGVSALKERNRKDAETEIDEEESERENRPRKHSRSGKHRKRKSHHHHHRHHHGKSRKRSRNRSPDVSEDEEFVGRVSPHRRRRTSRSSSCSSCSSSSTSSSSSSSSDSDEPSPPRDAGGPESFSLRDRKTKKVVAQFAELLHSLKRRDADAGGEESDALDQLAAVIGKMAESSRRQSHDKNGGRDRGRDSDYGHVAQAEGPGPSQGPLPKRPSKESRRQLAEKNGGRDRERGRDVDYGRAGPVPCTQAEGAVPITAPVPVRVGPPVRIPLIYRPAADLVDITMDDPEEEVVPYPRHLAPPAALPDVAEDDDDDAQSSLTLPLDRATADMARILSPSDLQSVTAFMRAKIDEKLQLEAEAERMKSRYARDNPALVSRLVEQQRLRELQQQRHWLDARMRDRPLVNRPPPQQQPRLVQQRRPFPPQPPAGLNRATAAAGWAAESQQQPQPPSSPPVITLSESDDDREDDDVGVTNESAIRRSSGTGALSRAAVRSHDMKNRPRPHTPRPSYDSPGPSLAGSHLREELDPPEPFDDDTQVSHRTSSRRHRFRSLSGSRASDTESDYSAASDITRTIFSEYSERVDAESPAIDVNPNNKISVRNRQLMKGRLNKVSKHAESAAELVNPTREQQLIHNLTSNSRRQDRFERLMRVYERLENRDAEDTEWKRLNGYDSDQDSVSSTHSAYYVNGAAARRRRSDDGALNDNLMGLQ